MTAQASNPAGVKMIERAITAALGKIMAKGYTVEQAAHGAIWAAIGLSAIDLEPVGTVEWLRDMADALERQLLDDAAPVSIQ